MGGRRWANLDARRERPFADRRDLDLAHRDVRDVRDAGAEGCLLVGGEVRSRERERHHHLHEPGLGFRGWGFKVRL